jgi:hypothetical protein
MWGVPALGGLPPAGGRAASCFSFYSYHTGFCGAPVGSLWGGGGGGPPPPPPARPNPPPPAPPPPRPPPAAPRPAPHPLCLP